MEVHKHTHTPRKKFAHYFWEFLMLFLAVFCGFLAEYQLEHKIEKDREKQYIRSLIDDLMSDTTQLNSLLHLYENVRIREDSLKNILLSPDVFQHAKAAYPLIGYSMDGYAFHRSERTIQQLKNAGGLRLIRSIDISNRINEYDESFHLSKEISGVIITTYHQYVNDMNQVVRAQYVGYPYNNGTDSVTQFSWLSKDPADFQGLLNTLINFQWVKSVYVNQLTGIREQAIELISYLRKEYRLKERKS